jgi:hypothetical protein
VNKCGFYVLGNVTYCMKNPSPKKEWSKVFSAPYKIFEKNMWIKNLCCHTSVYVWSMLPNVLTKAVLLNLHLCVPLSVYLWRTRVKRDGWVVSFSTQNSKILGLNPTTSNFFLVSFFKEESKHVKASQKVRIPGVILL